MLLMGKQEKIRKLRKGANTGSNIVLIRVAVS